MFLTTDLNQFINSKIISEIVILNDIQCTFVYNTVHRDINYDTRAERELAKLIENNKSKYEFAKIGIKIINASVQLRVKVIL